MDGRRAEIYGAITLVVVCVLVAVPVAVAQLAGDDILRGPNWLWWATYAAFIGAFLVTSWPHGIGWLTPQRTVVLMAALCLGVVGLAPFSWTPVLLVFSAATAAHVLDRRATAAVVTVNSVWLAGVVGLAGAPLFEAVFGAAMYTGLQVLTVWAVWLQLRETAARQRLAELHTELQAASALLAESSRSSERLRISRELHDVVGHQLTALALELEVAGHKVEGPAGEHVARARSLAKDLLRDVRVAVGELRDRPTDLAEALHAIVDDLPMPQVHLDVEAGLTVDGERVAALVRGVQELVTNTIRHAEAHHLWIEVRAGADGEVVLTARDDGVGAPTLELGNGLTGLRERVEAFDGAVTFDTRDGFRVEATLPDPARARSADAPVVAP